MDSLLEQARGAMHALLEHVTAKPGEFLTGVATLLLVLVTGLLVKATKELGEATKALAQSAIEDGRNRKNQATAVAWMTLRQELDLPNLAPEASKDDIDAAWKVALPQLRKLEAFAQGVNSGAYDLATFNDISGNWFRQQYHQRIKPIIDRRRKHNPDAYKQLVGLVEELEEMRSAATKE
jgi:hypothetical protein